MPVLDEAIIPDVIRVCERVASRHKEQICLGRDDMVSVALEKLVRSDRAFRREEMGLVAVIARTAIVDELRKLRYVSRKKLEDGTMVNRGHPLLSIWSYDEAGYNGGDSSLTAKDLLVAEQDDLSDTDHILESLPPREQFVVRALVDGYTHREIGEFLGITEGRVSQLLEGSRRRLILRQLESETNGHSGRCRRWPVESRARLAAKYLRRDGQGPYVEDPADSGGE